MRENHTSGNYADEVESHLASTLISNPFFLILFQTTRHGSKKDNVEKNRNPRIVPCKF